MFEKSRIVRRKTRKTQPPKPALMTVTGEYYQPVRIYYQVEKKNAVLGRLKRLRCVDYEQSNNRWVWFYKEEAKDLKFTTSYRDIPKEQRPIILGYFTWKGNRELQLDVCSFERVIEAIKFFDQKINRRLAKVAKIRVVNKLFPTTTTTEEMASHHIIFFEQSEAVDNRDEIKELEEVASQYESGEERHKAVLAHMQKQMKKTMPEIEELEASTLYEDGIDSMAFPLQMRLIEATEHWKGNKNFSQFDIMETLLDQFEGEAF